MNAALLSNAANLWRRIGSRNAIAVLATVCALFGALLVLGIYRVHDADSSPAPRFGVGAETVSEYELDSNDPVAHFPQTRIGHVLFAPRVGDHCQRVLFDNRTGEQYQAQSVDCSRRAAEVVASTDRMNALRRTFQK
jgi:hypothetical protein